MKKSWTWYLAHFSKINIGGNRCWLILVFVSATLSGVETLKYPSSYGICFFDKIFSFFNLASDFFSRWNFSKNGFSVLILRYWFIYIFDIRSYKNYFFHAKICFDNNFCFNKFICFFYKISITLLVSNPPSRKDGSFRWKDRWLLPHSSFFQVFYLWLKAPLLRSRWWGRSWPSR